MRRARSAAEWILRAALLIALVLAIREALTTMRELPVVSAGGGDSEIRAALADWSTRSSPRAAHLRFDSTPSPAARSWAAALAGAGTLPTWSSSLRAMGVGVEPIADPKGAKRIWVAAPSGSTVTLADSLGPVDSVYVRRVGASIGPLQSHGSVRAFVNGASAVATPADSVIVRPVLVLGRAGWEGKFAAVSLEEYGWKVDARFAVSPGNEVIQGTLANIDTARYAAVIVLDSSAVRYAPAIQRYVTSGGGLIVLGEGATVGALRALLPANAGAALPGGETKSKQPRDALPLRPLVQLTRDAIPLEKRGGRVAIAGGRFGRGRVVQVGYEDLWRWRMSGAGDPVEDSRNWWAGLVSSAAYAPRIPLGVRNAGEAAPVAAIHASLGAPTVGERGEKGTGEKMLMVLFVVAVGALVVETASRRLDGKP